MRCPVAGVRRVSAVAVGLGAAVVAAEFAHRAVAGHIPAGVPSTVVVLGYRSGRDGRPNRVQRWRIDQAARVVRHHRVDRMIITGGRTGGGDRSEAAVMAELAETRHPGLPPIVCEEEATSTWENVHRTIPLVDPEAPVILVSDPLHAGRARRYWLDQRPQDHNRVHVLDTVPRWRSPGMKLATAVVEAQRAGWYRLGGPDLRRSEAACSARARRGGSAARSVSTRSVP
ncbi:MAG: YdcF family protein [Acidimicrobiales bacterium]